MAEGGRFCLPPQAHLRANTCRTKERMELDDQALHLMMKLLKWFSRAPPADINPVSSDPELEKLAQFDTDMWGYLWRLQAAYEPKALHARVHSFVSRYRPTGWLADSSLGWGRLATEGAEVVTYEEGHGQFSMTLMPAKSRLASPRAWKLGRPSPLEGIVRFGNLSRKRPIHAN